MISSYNTIDKFEFDEKRHFYTLNGVKMYGVTSVLGVISKPQLIQWAANLATAKAFTFSANQELAKEISKYPKINTETAKKIGEKFPEFNEARNAHAQVRDDSANNGSNVHKIIEMLLKEAIISSGGILTVLSHPNRQVQQFLDWAREENIRFLKSEEKIYSKTLWVAGTMDLMFQKGDRTYVGDIKTTGAIWDRTPFFQTAAYEFMVLEREPNWKIEGRCIVRLDKEGSREVMYSDSPLDREGFLAALALYKALQAPISFKQKTIKNAMNKKKYA